jgi:hypothetical protein
MFHIYRHYLMESDETSLRTSVRTVAKYFLNFDK